MGFGDERLIGVTTRSPLIKLMEGYPIWWLDNEADKVPYKERLTIIVKNLMSIVNDKEFEEIINSEDISDITMFLSGKLWLINREK